MVQVFFVMLFFPVVMNALQYYIIDSFIKDQQPSENGPSPNEEGDEDSIDEDGRIRPRRPRGEGHDGAHDSDGGNETTKDGTGVKVSEGKDKPKLKVEPKKLDEYDPAIDGEGSGSSGEPESSPLASEEAKGTVQQSQAKES